MPRRPLLLLLCLTLCLPGTSAEIELPEIGDAAGGLLSGQIEQRIGVAFMRQVRQNMTVLDDALVNGYVQGLGLRLSRNSSDAQRGFDFFVVHDPTLNAFAGPGGYIGVNSGLILTTEREDELASVLGHEIAHVTQRHLPRALEHQQRMSVPTIAAMLGAIILGAYGGADAGAAAITAVQAGAVQNRIDFTRQNEAEADRIGIQTLAAAGFDARAMADFFGRMHQAARFSAGEKLPEFLRTHPVTLNRVAEARDRAAAAPRRRLPDRGMFQHMRERVRVLTAASATDALRYYAQNPMPEQPMAARAWRYGQALALLRSDRGDQAGDVLAALRAQDPDFLPYRVAEVERALAINQPARARELARDDLRLYPGEQALLRLLGEAELRAGEPATTRALLIDQARREHPSPKVLELLARAAEQRGDRIEAYQMRAEYHVQNGHLEMAMEQLRRASKLQPIAFAQLATIEARLRQLQEDLDFERQFFGRRAAARLLEHRHGAF
ncbi:MAG TPA: peptidase M48 Ste24p [Gammaproteobacteria bacterium]|uniref:M48 family metalloprotease n=1 Tax=Immundisolibacter sp. TaxID=1934948 RepID=UPI000E7E3FDA|nr:peptidase M48 Ste24p [Gammaproteobacteria bacterium]MCH77265.1 peptidase M48 Ste24p [Gammaproteobacteria bacterium]